MTFADIPADLLHRNGRSHVRNLGIPRAFPKYDCCIVQHHEPYYDHNLVGQQTVNTKKEKIQGIIDSSMAQLRVNISKYMRSVWTNELV